MSHQPTTAELLKRVQNRDEEALVLLHARYVNLVYSVAYRVLNDPMAAEEVTQDTFLRLWDKIDQFDPARGEFITWLLTITRRLAIDVLRKRQRHEPQQPMLFIDENPELWESALATEISEARRSLVALLGQLPHDQQDAIGLAYFYGMSHADIAAFRQVPLGTIKTRIRQGMQKLRSLWLTEQPIHPDQDLRT
jgi:RNA polymerase sigma-70 factor (ECF subfamily)